MPVGPPASRMAPAAQDAQGRACFRWLVVGGGFVVGPDASLDAADATPSINSIAAGSLVGVQVERPPLVGGIHRLVRGGSPGGGGWWSVVFAAQHGDLGE